MSMESVSVSAHISKRALVTRQAAHLLEDAVREATSSGSKEIRIDFAGIDAISPSFVDELFFVLANAFQDIDPERVEVTFIAPPTPPTAAYLAIARAHKSDLEETPDRNWRIKANPKEAVT